MLGSQLVSNLIPILVRQFQVETSELNLKLAGAQTGYKLVQNNELGF